MKYDIIALVISALVLSGCVYPFDINTDSEGKAGGLVVEGDLFTPYVDGEFKFTRWIIKKKDNQNI